MWSAVYERFMTRRGTLAYYLTAWVVGCFVVALLFTTTSQAMTVSLLLMTYFFALMGGLCDLLLFAFLLRRAMRFLGTHKIWIWMAGGAALFSALVYLLALVSQKRPEEWWIGTPLAISNFLLAGAVALRRIGFWQAPIDGALTAAVLCLVDRAFAPGAAGPEKTAAAKQSPA